MVYWVLLNIVTLILLIGNSNNTTMLQNMAKEMIIQENAGQNFQDMNSGRTSGKSQDITIPIIGLPIILGFILYAKSNRKILEFYGKYNFMLGGGSKQTTAKTIKPQQYPNASNPIDLIPIVTNVSNNLRGLITVYGVLLSFVITTKLSLALTSGLFVVWVGWILFVLIRSAYFCKELADIWETSKIDKAKEITVRGNRFFKNSFYLLVPTIAFLPAFAIAPSQIPVFPWGSEITIITIGVVIGLVVALMYYVYGNQLESRYSGTSAAVPIILILLLAAIGSILNPLTPKDVIVFGTTAAIPVVVSTATTLVFYMLLMFLTVYTITSAVTIAIRKIKNDKIDEKNV